MKICVKIGPSWLALYMARFYIFLLWDYILCLQFPTYYSQRLSSLLPICISLWVLQFMWVFDSQSSNATLYISRFHALYFYICSWNLGFRLLCLGFSQIHKSMVCYLNRCPIAFVLERSGYCVLFNFTMGTAT